VVTKMSEISSIALCREINFGFGKRLYMRCLRKERNGMAWLLGGVWSLKGIGRTISERKVSFRLR